MRSSSITEYFSPRRKETNPPKSPLPPPDPIFPKYPLSPRHNYFPKYCLGTQMTALNTMRVLRRGSHLCKPPPARIKSSHSPPCQLEDDLKKDNNILEDKTTRECITTQEVKTTSTTHSPGNINNKKDDISVVKTTLAEKTTLEKPVCVHRRGGWCTTHGGGAKKFCKTSKSIKINADGSQKVSYNK